MFGGGANGAAPNFGGFGGAAFANQFAAPGNNGGAGGNGGFLASQTQASQAEGDGASKTSGGGDESFVGHWVSF